MLKDFDNWNDIKKLVHAKLVNVSAHKREIWWVSFGVNVGSEQDGKGLKFERPVVIIKKLSPNVYYVLPLSTKCKAVQMHIPIHHDSITGYVLLDQMKAMDKKRFLRKIGTVEVVEFDNIITAFKDLFVSLPREA